jgi:1-acyl-sn-glycerol-3-phosphate acyltransferase
LPSFLRSSVRSLYLLVLLLSASLELLITRPATLPRRAAWLQRTCARLLRAMNVRAICEGPFPSSGIIVTNHTGYLEIIALAAQHPCVFVAGSELADIPLLGYMATMSGTVFVQRGQGGSALRAKASIDAAVNASLPIVIFPEGTTTDGTSMLEFHGGALSQAMATGIPVTAGCVSYRLTGNNPPGITIRNDVAYWGDINLFRHIFNLMALHGVEVVLRFAPQPIAFPATAADRKQIAAFARTAVSELRTLT